MATITVTNTDDSGAGSLRQAIADANNGDTIRFDPSLSGSTIVLSSTLVIAKDLTIVGDVNGDRKADITISGNDAARIFEIPIAEVELRSLNLAQGYADIGGAIRSNGSIAVIDSTISDSTATNVGGAVYAAKLTLVNSTVTGNTAAWWGGGIFVASGGTAAIVNATIHGNSTTSGGGGISNDPAATLSILNSTITGNHANGQGGGVDVYNGATYNIANTVIAGNTASSDPDIAKTLYAPNPVPVILNASNSFFGTGADIDSGTGNIAGTVGAPLDPLLGPLAENGGPVQTQAILPGSPLIGAGNAALLPNDDLDLDSDSDTGEALPQDARGNARVANGALDIGAMEFIQNNAPVLTGLGPSVTFLENTVNAAPQLLDANVSFIDPNNNFDGGALTVTGLLPEDSVSVRDQGSAAGEIGFDPDTGEVSFGGVVIGTASGGDSGSDLLVTFNAAATSAAIEALIENLTYANSSDNPTASRTLNVTLTDADSASTLRASYTEVTDPSLNPFASVSMYSYATIAFADIDGDGDDDAVVGETDGTLWYFENAGGSFVQRTGAANPFDGIDVGYFADPVFTDLNGDGLIDLVVGSQSEALEYYLNTGSSAAPVFTKQTGGANPFSAIGAVAWGAPTFADLDDDGDLDLLIGTSSFIGFYFYENSGTASDPIFTPRVGVDNPFDGIVPDYPNPYLIDFDGDGDFDLVFGSSLGPIQYFENVGTASVPNFVERTGAAKSVPDARAGWRACIFRFRWRWLSRSADRYIDRQDCRLHADAHAGDRDRGQRHRRG